MPLTYQQIKNFVRKNGDVTAWVAKRKVTMLRSGQADNVSALEKDADRFEFEGKSYTRDEFEALVRSDESQKA